jgi:hypothetical protein
MPYFSKVMNNTPHISNTLEDALGDICDHNLMCLKSTRRSRFFWMSSRGQCLWMGLRMLDIAVHFAVLSMNLVLKIDVTRISVDLRMKRRCW